MITAIYCKIIKVDVMCRERRFFKVYEEIIIRTSLDTSRDLS